MKRLEELPLRKCQHGGGRAEAYPYDLWLDGFPNYIERGEDFHWTKVPASVASSCRDAAKRRGGYVKTRDVTDRGFTIQFFTQETESL